MCSEWLTYKYTLLCMCTDIIKRLKERETVFLVTQYHQFRDLTAQSAHQAFCNFLSLLEVHQKRHKWITKAWRYKRIHTHIHTYTHTWTHTHRQTDNCYTYECKKICLALTEVFKITGVQLLGSNNNEPNHGGFLADQSGAIMKNALWRWTLKHSKPIQQAR